MGPESEAQAGRTRLGPSAVKTLDRINKIVSGWTRCNLVNHGNLVIMSKTHFHPLTTETQRHRGCTEKSELLSRADDADELRESGWSKVDVVL